MAKALLESRAFPSPAEKREHDKCAADVEHWLFAYAKTKDEHDATMLSKPFPQKAYLREIIRFWKTHRMNLIEKSRQLMLSWLLCALYTHDAQFGVNRLTFLMSKKEEDSDRLVQRCYVLYQNQPAFLRRMHPAVYSYCHLKFFAPGQTGGLPLSELWGVPQGGDILRQHVASGLLIDEGGFQEDLEASIGAAQPLLKGGGRLDVVSTANPSYFQLLVEDRIT